jgi:hypothetical protein
MKLITSIDEITEQDVINKEKFVTPKSQAWFEIKKGTDGYTVYGMICGSAPNFVSRGDTVIFYKTLNSVKRGLKRLVINGYWGFGNRF